MVNLNQAIVLLIIVTIAAGQACTTANPGCSACVNATSTLCTGCHAGFGFDPFLKNCTACPALFYSDTTSATDFCIACTSVNTACGGCLSTTGACNNCKAGHFWNSATPACQVCPLNQWSLGGAIATATSCSSCTSAACLSC